MQPEGLLIVISAPSGAGKTTLCRELTRRFPALTESISYTTRTPRKGETNGEDYHFVTNKQFEEMIRNNAFAEWAKVHGNHYGTAIKTLEDARKQGIDILLDIDCQGAKTLKNSGVSGVFIFVLPPSMQELRRRLEARSSDSKDVIEHRIAAAAAEMKESRWYDYIIVNDRLEDAQEAIAAVVTAARCATTRMLPAVSKMFDI
ncbi:MAG: guanylate kinase [Trichlorobacter sp.]|nr:guanylate kinase [Trichlorobacter sp.]